MKFKLKDGLLLGTATAATQIEGGDENNNWARFAAQGKVLDGTSPLRADDHYVRWQEDIDLMAELGLQIYRFGIEWSRIEPQRGVYDQSVIDHYRREIAYMKERGIRPMLTIHHFTNPLWFEDMGGFTHPDSPDIFMTLVEKVVESFGDLVEDYITINEPNVYATNSFYFGVWPPEQKSIGALIKVFSNMTASHIRAYEYIHARRKALGYGESCVSFANHLRIFAPENPKNPLHRMFAGLTRWLFQTAITDAMMTGRCTFPVQKRPGIKPGKYYDFIGINYYSRSSVSGLADGVRAGCEKNDLGWEIYHEGLIELANDLYARYRAPVFVTENGTCDNSDAFRPLFLYDQLKLICETDNPIQRYYHWSFTDNFEWKEGESARFGIVHVDYETQKRTVKPSGKLYAAILADGGVTEESYQTYVAPCHYHK